MKKLLYVAAFWACSACLAHAQTYKFVTTIESVVPGGLGRSRMLVSEESGTAAEIELKNFFSMVGIQFGNIKQNEATILSKLTEMEKNGYKLINVSTGVYSGENQGIFITRYLYRKD